MRPPSHGAYNFQYHNIRAGPARSAPTSSGARPPMLLEAAWNYDFEPRGNIVDMHIHRLRHKVDEGFPSRLIHTVPGAGYTVRQPDDAASQIEPAT